MALRNIMNYQTDEVLRKKAKPVENIDGKIHSLLKDMTQTMYKAKGIGLAAPQIGILRKVVVMDIGEGLIKLINPAIVEVSGEQLWMEGCLSIPGIYGMVTRPQKVTLEAVYENGCAFVMECEGLLARAFCHEIDHLDGLLFIDKAIIGSLVSQDMQSDVQLNGLKDIHMEKRIY